MKQQPLYQFSNDDLINAVKTSKNVREICQKLKVPHDYHIVHRKIKELNLDMSHIPQYGRKVKSSYTDEQLIEAVKESKTIFDVCRKLGLKEQSLTATRIRNKIKNLELNVPLSMLQMKAFPDKIFIENTEYSERTIKEYYTEQIDEPKCNSCGITDWCQSKLILMLNYKNNNKKDARLENLELLCPNCFSLLRKQEKSNYDERLKLIESILPKCQSFMDVSRSTGINDTSVRYMIRSNQLNIDHFNKKSKDGQNKGSTIDTLTTSGFIKTKITETRDSICTICNISNEWLGKRLVLIMDHIDGNNKNNNPNNLRLVCPNCNIQLETYGMRNKKLKRLQKEKAQSE